MKSSSYHLLALIALLPLLSGCGLIYYTLVGVDTSPKWESDKALARQAKRYDIPPAENLVLDTVTFYSGLSEVYKSKKKEIVISSEDSTHYFRLKRASKDDTQPTQFRLFNHEGQEVFKVVNCYVESPMKMDWNIQGCFDSFPPQIGIESLNTHVLDLDFFLSRSSTLEGNTYSLADLPVADYYGLILWNDMMKRPSKELIKTIRAYVEQSAQSIHLIYINNHNAMLWQLMDAELREEVKQRF